MGTYTHGHHETVLSSHRWRTAENSAAHLLPHLRSGLSLLDVGCGPGTITADLAAIVAPGRVLGLEMYDEALVAARAEIGGRDLGNVDFATGDAMSLQLDDASYDVVHTHQVLHHLSDPVQALREMRRVCKPGGVVAVRESDYDGFTWAPNLPELAEWMAMYQAIARGNGAEPDTGRHLLAWAHAAGFTDVTASSSTWCFATSEDRLWWGTSWAERVEQSAFATQAVERGLATADDLRRIADGWRRWAADADGWFSVLHGELIARP